MTSTGEEITEEFEPKRSLGKEVARLKEIRSALVDMRRRAVDAQFVIYKVYCLFEAAEKIRKIQDGIDAMTRAIEQEEKMAAGDSRYQWVNF